MISGPPVTPGYGVRLSTWDELPRADAIVAAVSHRELLVRIPANVTAELG